MGSLDAAYECNKRFACLPTHCYKDMNHIFVKFEQLFFKQTKGYLSVDEMLVDWDSELKLLPLRVMRADYVHRTGDVIDDYSEYYILTQLYNT